MRDGVKLFTCRLRPEGRGADSIPILLNRTPYTVAPYGDRQVPANLGPTEKFVREGFIFVYQDVRGRASREGNVRQRPAAHRRSRRGPKDIDESTDTYDTIDWLVKNVPNNNGKRRHVRHLVSGLLRRDGHHRRAPRAEGDVAAGAGHGLVHRRRFPSQRRPLPGARLRLLLRLRPPATPPSCTARRTRASTSARRTATTSICALGRSRISTRSTSTDKSSSGRKCSSNDTYDDFWQSRAICGRYLKNVKPAVHDGGRLVRRRGPARRRCSMYKSHGEAEPGRHEHARRWAPGCTAAGRAATATASATCSFGSKTARLLSATNIEFPFFLYHLKGKGDGDKLPEAYMFETGRNEWRKLDAWPPQDAKPKTLYFDAGGQARRASSPPEPAEAFDEYVSDPKKPVPFIGAPAHGHDLRATWWKTSASPPRAPTC